MQKVRLLFLCGIVALTGCVYSKHKPGKVVLRPLSEKLASEVHTRPAITTNTIVPLPNEEFGMAKVELVTDTSTNVLECYYPERESPSPVIMILPVSGGGYFIERSFAKYFCKKGYAAIIVYREGDRHPESAYAVNRMLRQSVENNQTVLDWICLQPEYDSEKIGVLGTSMGSIKASLLMAVDDRPKAAVMGLGGGDVAYILANSKDGSLRGGGISKRREKMLDKIGMTKDEFETELRSKIEWDPLYVASSVDPHKVMMFIALFDKVVPTKKGKELRKAMNYPKTVFLLSGHYSSIAYLPFIHRESLNFFEEKGVR